MMAKELVMSKYDSIEVCIADILWYVLVLYTVYNENMYLRGGGYEYENAQSLRRP
jgi:hypothetical protein